MGTCCPAPASTDSSDSNCRLQRVSEKNARCFCQVRDRAGNKEVTNFIVLLEELDATRRLSFADKLPGCELE